MNTFKKTVIVGTTSGYPDKITIEYTLRDDKGRLSLTGVIADGLRSDCLAAGQIVNALLEYVKIPSPSWPKEKLEKLIEIWHRWHLNDMNAACEHQRNWPLDKPLDVQIYTQVGTRCDDIRAFIRGGRATEEEKNLLKLSDDIWGAMTTGGKHGNFGGSSPYPAEDIVRLLGENMLAKWKIEQKTAGGVYPFQHPEGLLCKPCEVCGYEYGSAWLYEAVPEDVLEWLRDC